MRFRTATDKYLRSRQFASLSSSSQKGYENKMLSFCSMRVMGKTLGNVRLLLPMPTIALVSFLF